jgi:hypothetical protein
MTHGIRLCFQFYVPHFGCKFILLNSFRVIYIYLMYYWYLQPPSFFFFFFLLLELFIKLFVYMLSLTKNRIAVLNCILLYWSIFVFLNCNFKYSGNSANITGSQVLFKVPSGDCLTCISLKNTRLCL